jgi:hypothetical protein
MGARTLVAHGALDHAELAARGLRPEALLDFSSNLNPFGPPPGVRASLASLDPAPYPDRSCLRLRQELAARHRCALEQVLAGNGSNELIHLLARALLRPGDVSLVAHAADGLNLQWRFRNTFPVVLAALDAALAERRRTRAGFDLSLLTDRNDPGADLLGTLVQWQAHGFTRVILTVSPPFPLAHFEHLARQLERVR